MSNNQQQNKGKGGKERGEGKGEGNNKPRRERVPEVRRIGLVRGVPSGDTLLIMDLPENPNAATGAPKDVQLTLLGLQAPVLGKRFMKEGKVETEKDEPFAWESREYLRNKVIGRCVVYRIVYEAGERSYGEVWLNGENIRETVVNAGWANVPSRGKANKDGEVEISEEQQRVLDLLDGAKKKEKGIWKKHKDTQAGVRRVKYRDAPRRDDPARAGREDELFQFFEKNKNKTLHAVVEQVLSGSSLRVYLPETSDNVPVQLSGASSPNYKTVESEYLPFSYEAKFFTEYNLLHRNVEVTLDGIDKNMNFYATVLDSQGGNVALSLLQMGLASYVDWSCKQSVSAKFQEAEKEAQKNKIRVWSAEQPKRTPQTNTPKKADKKSNNSVIAANNTDKTFVGKVVEIINAGNIRVRVTKGDKTIEEKVTLSSIKTFAPPARGLAKEKQEAEADADAGEVKDAAAKAKSDRDAIVGWEGREFLRGLLIGKRVNCNYDYSRQDPRTKENYTCYSVYINDGKNDKQKNNVAKELIVRGFATVVPHGKDDARSPDYQEFIVAEKTAQSKNLGIHGKKVLRAVQDLTPPPKKQGVEEEAKDRSEIIKNYFPKSATKLTVVIEKVFSGGRFKVYVPSEGILVNFACAGITVERFEKTLPDNHPARRAYNDAYEQLMQRSVDIQIVNVDKSGTILGQLWNNKKDWGLHLVELGLAKIFGSFRSLENANKYQEAEQVAKSSNRGVWVDFDVAADKAAMEERKKKRQEERDAADAEFKEARAQNKADFNIEVTEIVTGTHFYYQVIGDETQALSDLMKTFQGVNWGAEPAHTPAKDELVAAKFSDGHWYRARVTFVHGLKKKGEEAQEDTPLTFDVLYVDYGNKETLGADRIRVLPSQYNEEVLPGQAFEGRLAYIKAPAIDDDFGRDSAALFKELVWGKRLIASQQGRDGLILSDPEVKMPISAYMVTSGLARVQRKPRANKFFEELQKEEEKAKKARLNIWQYGDAGDSDDEREERALLR
eukprot:TRINITY_DN2851_c0_g1_i1.p1 TRINITY_DN2851_c0_g1~~TRINITY_DN2851_c0_g1_i1.p1  ORF type:complete len:1009 (+),score=324.55 TRINITY_DN2851_c0_g1_i1:75-3101(+)